MQTACALSHACTAKGWQAPPPGRPSSAPCSTACPEVAGGQPPLLDNNDKEVIAWRYGLPRSTLQQAGGSGGGDKWGGAFVTQRGDASL
jgi:hypothetical protein